LLSSWFVFDYWFFLMPMSHAVGYCLIQFCGWTNRHKVSWTLTHLFLTQFSKNASSLELSYILNMAIHDKNPTRCYQLLVQSKLLEKSSNLFALNFVMSDMKLLHKFCTLLLIPRAHCKESNVSESSRENRLFFYDYSFINWTKFIAE
jgi:hypothetical protein